MYWFGAVQKLLSLRSPGSSPIVCGPNVALVKWMHGVKSNRQFDWDGNLNMPIFYKWKEGPGGTYHNYTYGPPQGNIVKVTDLVPIPVAVVPHPAGTPSNEPCVYVGFAVRDSHFFHDDVPEANRNSYHHAIREHITPSVNVVPAV